MACFESPITIPYLRCNYHAPLKRYYETTYRESYQPPDMIIKDRIEEEIRENCFQARKKMCDDYANCRCYEPLPKECQPKCKPFVDPCPPCNQKAVHPKKREQKMCEKENKPPADCPCKGGAFGCYYPCYYHDFCGAC